MATTFAPIIFHPASVLAFKENPNGTLDLVASGQVLSVDPDRLIIKRVVLSGHPFKINKKSSIIRFMFFNRDDINWFKPVELRTKYGRRGHIKEALGTTLGCKSFPEYHIKNNIISFRYSWPFQGDLRWSAQISGHGPPLLV